jgi:hypothetical protein
MKRGGGMCIMVRVIMINGGSDMKVRYKKQRIE